jgi:hypothetical protein
MSGVLAGLAKVGAQVGAKIPQGVKVAAGIVGDIAPDVGFGAAAIQQQASTSMSEGEKAYQVTGEIIGVTANIVVGTVTTGASIGGTVGATLTGGAALGPIGIAVAAVIAIVQILGSIIDQFVNPFQPMFNRNLNEMRAAYHSAIKEAYLEMGLNWPLEVKPDIISDVFADPDKFEKYQKYVKEYYSDRNLLAKEDYLKEYNLLLEIRKLVRNSRDYYYDESGNITGKQDVNDDTFEIIAEGQKNLLLILALNARIAKYKKENTPKSSIIKKFIEAYYITMIIWSISLCLLIIFSIFFLFI